MTLAGHGGLPGDVFAVAPVERRIAAVVQHHHARPAVRAERQVSRRRHQPRLRQAAGPKVKGILALMDRPRLTRAELAVLTGRLTNTG